MNLISQERCQYPVLAPPPCPSDKQESEEKSKERSEGKGGGVSVDSSQYVPRGRRVRVGGWNKGRITIVSDTNKIPNN